MNSRLNPSAKCPKCGHSKFVTAKPRTDKSIVTCEKCGANLGEWGKFRDSFIADAAKPLIEDAKKKLQNIARKFGKR